MLKVNQFFNKAQGIDDKFNGPHVPQMRCMATKCGTHRNTKTFATFTDRIIFPLNEIFNLFLRLISQS